MSKLHTPGPWTVYDDKSPIIMANIEGENYDVAVLPDEYLTQKELQANAKLIAAAPELLEACKSALADTEMLLNGEADFCDDNLKATIETLVKAIKKATK